MEYNYLENDFLSLEEADTLINSFASIIITDDTLMRLVAYDKDNALSKDLPEVPQSERFELIKQSSDAKRILFNLYNDDLEADVQTQIRMEIVDASSRDNITSEILIGVEVLTHNTIQLLDDSTKNRSWRIASRFIDLLNGNESIESISPPLYNRGRGIKKRHYNKSFSGHYFYMYVWWEGSK